MDGTEILKIGVGMLCALIFTWGMIKFIRWLRLTNKIKANFIYDDRTLENKNYHAVVDNLEFKEFTYDYDDNLTVKRKGIKNIYYIVGNKKPLDLHNPDVKGMSYADFQKIIKSKVLNDLLEDEDKGLSKSEIFILVGMAILGIVVIGFMWWQGQQPTIIEMSPTLNEFIKNSVIEAIKS